MHLSCASNSSQAEHKQRRALLLDLTRVFAVAAMCKRYEEEISMPTFRQISLVCVAAAFVTALAIDAADARRGGGGMRAGGGGMRAGNFGGAGRAGMGNRAHVSHPIARPGRPGDGPGWGNRPGYGPGWGNRPGYGPGWGYRPGYGWGAAAAAVGAGLAYSTYDPYYGGYGYSDYGYYNQGAYASPSDPIAECARRFKTYDPASQTYVVRKGVRASCP